MFSRLRKRKRSKSRTPMPRNEDDLMLRGMIEASDVRIMRRRYWKSDAMDDTTTHLTDTGRIDFLNVLNLEKVVTETMYRIPVDIIAKQKKPSQFVLSSEHRDWSLSVAFKQPCISIISSSTERHLTKPRDILGSAPYEAALMASLSAPSSCTKYPRNC